MTGPASETSESELTELAGRFKAVYTGAVTDVLDELNYLHQTLPPEIAPLERGMVVAGPAFTVEGRGAVGQEYEPSIRRILEMLGSIPTQHVAIYQANDRSSAHFGELSATSLRANGCAGVVVDGGSRDIRRIIEEGFPVFSRYVTPQDAVPRWAVLGWGHEIVIGDVRIAPGDYVFGDLDGIVVIPASVRDEVLEKAESIVHTENRVRDAVRAGVKPLAAFERYGKF